MDTGLAGKGVVVTGASGGIGAACARLFAAEGANVLVHYHRGEERAAAVAAEIGGAPIAQADLTVEADVDRLFATARETLGSVDVCAAVAGVWPAEDLPVWELPLERWEETMRQNLTATFLTARGFLREVARTGHGSLVLVGSTAGRFGEAGHADYAAAKSALQGGLLLSLKNEVARVAPRARVNAVAPGWTESPMTRGLVDPRPCAGSHARWRCGRSASPRTWRPRSSCSPPTSSPATSAARSSPSPAGWKAASSTTTPEGTAWHPDPEGRLDHPPGGVLDRGLGPDALEPGARGHTFARLVADRRPQLEPGRPQARDDGVGDELQRPGREPAPARVGAEPVAELDRVTVEKEPEREGRRIARRPFSGLGQEMIAVSPRPGA